MNKIYVLQASIDKGNSWFNLKKDNRLMAFEFKVEAKSALDEYFVEYTETVSKFKVKPVAKKWFRVVELNIKEG